MSDNKRKVAILGSTGSIGVQALEVIDKHQEYFSVSFMCAANNYELLARQAAKFLPACVGIANPAHYSSLKAKLAHLPIEVISGSDAIAAHMLSPDSGDVVLTAMVGFAGLQPTVNAIESGKDIALSNKETLVVAGASIMPLAEKHQVDILPVDSEHSAIFQCLKGRIDTRLEKIILTASGGPFRGKTKEDLRKVTKKQALKHPNWEMGAKITIDSATLMNKGLEVIEAKWLFDLQPEQVEVVVHPQSVLHSMVQYVDGSMLAQMGVPDMKLPILYALTHPNRIQTDFERFDFMKYNHLTFEKPDMDTFQNLSLAFEALHKGGNASCALNAANEISVAAFLREQITFLDIFEINAATMQKVAHLPNPALSDYFETDQEARKVAGDLIA